VIIALFVIWHILDLTLGTVNPDPAGGAYARLVASFDRPVVAIFYILAMVALSTHISHGLWSGIQTLGGNSAIRQRSLKIFSITVGVVIAVGFAIIPISVMTGLVR
jgi:succinate dehydrogenase / fumarate reductase cytochrome b subunit